VSLKNLKKYIPTYTYSPKLFSRYARITLQINVYIIGDFSEYFEEKSTQKFEKIVKNFFHVPPKPFSEINVLLK